MGSAVCESCVKGGAQEVCAVEGEQARQAVGQQGGAAVAREGGGEKGFHLRDGEAQGGALCGGDSSSFDGKQRVGVSRIGEALPLVVGAAVVGHLVDTVE